MLKIEGLKVSFGDEQILNGIDLEVKTGECVAVIGESGAGKTTLGLSAMKLLNGNMTGKIYLENTEILALSEEDMRQLRWNRVAMAFQSAQNRLNPTHQILDQVAEPMIAHQHCSKTQAQQRAAGILNKAGLAAGKYKYYPYQLSAGEQQRVLIAMSLINNPAILILDEPMSALDASSRMEMIAFLKLAIMNRTVLVMTHDISTAARLASSVATLYGGHIVELGAINNVLSHPRHPYTRALLRSYPNMTTTKDLQGIKGRMERWVTGCAFHPRCTQATSICQKRVPSLLEHNGWLVACHRGGIVPALSVNNLSKSFGKLRAVDGVSLILEHGETLALVGQSGSGKTTLARMMTGLLEPDTGYIRLESEKSKSKEKNYHRNVQLIFQNPGEALSHRLTVMESVREPLEIQGIGNKLERDQIVKRVIDEVELPTTDTFLDEYPHHLSGGELQRVNIARALVLSPQVLIADEPTAFLDSSVQAKVLRLLMNLQENRGLSMLFITHDIAVARKISDRIAVMEAGKIVEQGSTSQVITSPSHPYTRKLLDSAAELHLMDGDETTSIISNET